MHQHTKGYKKSRNETSLSSALPGLPKLSALRTTHCMFSRRRCLPVSWLTLMIRTAAAEEKSEKQSYMAVVIPLAFPSVNAPGNKEKPSASSFCCTQYCPVNQRFREFCRKTISHNPCLPKYLAQQPERQKLCCSQNCSSSLPLRWSLSAPASSCILMDGSGQCHWCSRHF